jgi:hypothetical protein
VDPRSGLDDMQNRKFLTLQGLELRPLQAVLYRPIPTALSRFTINDVDKIMETCEKLNLFVLAALKELQLANLNDLFLCFTLCTASVPSVRSVALGISVYL